MSAFGQALELPDVNDPQWPTRLVEQLLSGNLIDTGGVQLGMRFGQATVTFSAAATAPAVTVPHGLGRIPRVIQCTRISTAGGTSVVEFPVANITATTFDIVARTTAALTATITVMWEAKG